MKTTAILAMAGLLATLDATYAADMRLMPLKAPSARAAGFEWSGFYAGVEGGGAFTRNHFIFEGPAETSTFDYSGALLGVVAGVNYQIGGFVLGAETTADWAPARGQIGCTLGLARVGAVCASSNSYLLTAAGRMGFVLADTLLYAKLGVAARDEAAAVNGVAAKEHKFAALYGVGIERPIGPNVTIGLEYTLHDFSRLRCREDCGSVLPVTTELKESVVKGRIIWHF